jgi:hypothetical protein
MGRILILLIFMIPAVCIVCPGQSDSAVAAENGAQKYRELDGFVRGGLYFSTGRDNKSNPAVSTLFSDLGLKFKAGNNLNFKTVADLRFRYGSEFASQVSRLIFREGYVQFYGKNWDITLGQKIIKWGRADFTNPTSRLNPVNYIVRSPDKEDMDLGNLIVQSVYSPVHWLRLEAVAVPIYRPSELLISPIPLPGNVKFNQRTSLYADKQYYSYGIRSDFHFQGLDFGLSWFDGFNPSPGIALSSFNLDLSSPIPVPEIALETKPYRIRMAGLDYEFVVDDLGLRGEASFSSPCLGYSSNEYVPYPEFQIVTGADWSSGIWRIIAEYTFKKIIGFSLSAVPPVFGGSTDYAQLAVLLQDPEFDMAGYVRQQVAAFNRLYNYQLKSDYHSAGLKIEADLLYGKLAPSFFSMYNFSSYDLLLMPELRIKPADGIAITAGMEYYNGKKGSLYDIVDGFMNCIYVGIRVDF